MSPGVARPRQGAHFTREALVAPARQAPDAFAWRTYAAKRLAEQLVALRVEGEDDVGAARRLVRTFPIDAREGEAQGLDDRCVGGRPPERQRRGRNSGEDLAECDPHATGLAARSAARAAANTSGRGGSRGGWGTRVGDRKRRTARAAAGRGTWRRPAASGVARLASV